MRRVAGRTYGYRSEPVHEPGRSDPHGQPIPIGYRITLEPAEAAVVGQIFKLFRDGLGEKAIAKQLNLNHGARPWRPNTIYLMLQNSKYVGQFYFNRRDWRKNPETGRRVYRWRPRDQWESRMIEALRIIDDETWEAVQCRLKSRQHLFSRRRSATTHLLSGLLICDRCGGRLSIAAKDYYGCRNHIESGTCSNDLRIRREAVEELVIQELALRLPEYIEIRYDRGVMEDFVARLPEALRKDVRLGREFLRETLRHVRIADGDRRQRTCPLCDQVLGKLTPQHLALHGITLREAYRRFPELGFAKGARLTVQPSPEGLLNTGEVFGWWLRGPATTDITMFDSMSERV